jgi:hypothetical protein
MHAEHHSFYDNTYYFKHQNLIWISYNHVDPEQKIKEEDTYHLGLRLSVEEN